MLHPIIFFNFCSFLNAASAALLTQIHGAMKIPREFEYLNVFKVSTFDLRMFYKLYANDGNGESGS